MPAIYTFKVNVNLPPKGGKITIDANSGSSIITQFFI